MKKNNTQPMPEKKKINKVKADVYAAYKEEDSQRGYDIADNSGLCEYKYCKACDTDRPVIKGEHECLFCGQPTQPTAQEQGKELFTGGEWEIDSDLKGNFHELMNGRTVIAHIFNERSPYQLTKDEAKANAELIASAPRLYRENKELREALQAVYHDIELNNVKGGSDELNVIVQKALGI